MCWGRCTSCRQEAQAECREGSGEERPGGWAASPVSLERGCQPAELWGAQGWGVQVRL